MVKISNEQNNTHLNPLLQQAQDRLSREDLHYNYSLLKSLISTKGGQRYVPHIPYTLYHFIPDPLALDKLRLKDRDV